MSLTTSRQDRQTIAALHETGFIEQPDDPWFAQLWRSLDDLSDIDSLTNRTDYRIRPVTPGERAARVRLHQQAIVGPRGDPDYPIPGRIYRGLGMIEVAQFVPYVHCQTAPL